MEALGFFLCSLPTPGMLVENGSALVVLGTVVEAVGLDSTWVDLDVFELVGLVVEEAVHRDVLLGLDLLGEVVGLEL